ncbi:MAG: sugar phosphate isomerase/epimerase family protein [Thermomicrobiales bacterium]
MTRANAILISAMQFDEAISGGAMTQRDLFDIAPRLGADGVEVRDSYWGDRPTEIEVIQGAASARNLVVTYATMTTLLATDAAGEARLRQNIDDAVALGARFVRVFQGVLPTNADDPAWERARRTVAYAAAREMVVALENYAKMPGNRVTEIMQVLDAIQSPALGTNVDIGNYAANGEEALAAIAALGPRVVASHLKDVRGAATVGLGEGDLPLAAIFAAFDRLPQPVVYCLEFEGGPDPEARIVASLGVARAMQGG